MPKIVGRGGDLRAEPATDRRGSSWSFATRARARGGASVRRSGDAPRARVPRARRSSATTSTASSTHRPTESSQLWSLRGSISARVAHACVRRRSAGRRRAGSTPRLRLAPRSIGGWLCRQADSVSTCPTGRSSASPTGIHAGAPCPSTWDGSSHRYPARRQVHRLELPGVVRGEVLEVPRCAADARRRLLDRVDDDQDGELLPAWMKFAELYVDDERDHCREAAWFNPSSAP